MICFTIYRVLSLYREINARFKLIVTTSISVSGLFTVFYFIFIVVGGAAFTPQYVIPISGMVMGNTMTGVTLALKTFLESAKEQRNKIEAMQCAGISAHKGLLPFVRPALETAMLPTINSMLGMGIVSLPGMMTGQILTGTVPTTAILYQIAIMIAICTTVICSCFFHSTLEAKPFTQKHVKL